MIADLKPYPAYKASGVPWLGNVPEHWEVLPNRSLFEEVKDQNHPDEPLLSVTISRGVLQQIVLLSDTSKKDSSNLDKSKYKLVQPGDIAYNKMRAWQGAIGASRFRGIVSPAYIVQRPRSGVMPEYMHFLLRTPGFATEAERWSYGITSDQWSLRSEHFKMIYCSLPSWDEQTTIVRFLDHMDRRIRRAIRVKQKLIALLNEQKQAIIHQAVTRGLDPNVRLKHSGVEWLGDVPEHWEVLQLRRLVKRGTTITYGIVQAGPDIEGGVPYIRTSDMKSQHFRRTGYLRTSQEIDASYARSKVDCDDLVVAIRASLGKGMLVPAFLAGANLTQGTARVSPGQRLSPRFLMRAFNSYYCQESIRTIAKGTTFLEITLAALRRLPMAVPPLSEQAEIVDILDASLKSVEEAAQRAEREISLLREYRTRLIADVVTGKLDVRAVAARLPEEAEAPETFDEADALEGGDEEIAEAGLDTALEEATA